jgi:hypothetical protein
MVRPRARRTLVDPLGPASSDDGGVPRAWPAEASPGNDPFILEFRGPHTRLAFGSTLSRSCEEPNNGPATKACGWMWTERTVLRAERVREPRAAAPTLHNPTPSAPGLRGRFWAYLRVGERHSNLPAHLRCGRRGDASGLCPAASDLESKAGHHRNPWNRWRTGNLPKSAGSRNEKLLRAGTVGSCRLLLPREPLPPFQPQISERELCADTQSPRKLPGGSARVGIGYWSVMVTGTTMDVPAALVTLRV